MKTFTVVVSKLPGKSGLKKSHYSARLCTMWSAIRRNQEWSGTDLIVLPAEDGDEAKEEAIDIVFSGRARSVWTKRIDAKPAKEPHRNIEVRVFDAAGVVYSHVVSSQLVDTLNYFEWREIEDEKKGNETIPRPQKEG